MLKEWLVPMIKTWASQKKRAMRGYRRFGDGKIHEDGWAEVSMAAFAHEGGITGGSGQASQRLAPFPYTGAGLLVWEIYQEAPIEVRDMLLAHYIAGGRAKGKAREMKISIRVYWQRLECAHYYVAGGIPLREKIKAGAPQLPPI